MCHMEALKCVEKPAAEGCVSCMVRRLWGPPMRLSLNSANKNYKSRNGVPRLDGKGAKRERL